MLELIIAATHLIATIACSPPEMNGGRCHLFFGLCTGFGIALRQPHTVLLLFPRDLHHTPSRDMRRFAVRQRPLQPSKRIRVYHLSADGSFISETGERVTASLYDLDDCVSGLLSLWL